MKKKLIIIGASGHGKVAADIAIKMNQWENIEFLDDDESVKNRMGLHVVGKVIDAYKYKEKSDFFVAIGNNEIRKKIQENLKNSKLSIISLIHPSVIIGTDVEIGIGTIIMAGAVINSASKIGNGCIINTSSSLDHDNFIEDYVHISPGVNLAGMVKVCKGSWLGIGSSVCNNVNICSECIIGAGGVVVKDIVEGGTYVGIPVKRVNR